MEVAQVVILGIFLVHIFGEVDEAGKEKPNAEDIVGLAKAWSAFQS